MFAFNNKAVISAKQCHLIGSFFLWVCIVILKVLFCLCPVLSKETGERLVVSLIICYQILSKLTELTQRLLLIYCTQQPNRYKQDVVLV